MKKVFESVQNYKNARLEAIEKYNTAMKWVDQNYIKNSERYNERVNTLKAERDAAITAFKKVGLETAQQEFEKIKEQVQKVVSITPTEDIERILSRVGKMTELEKNLVLEQHKGSYMDSKILHEAMGKPFTTIDDVMENLVYVEAEVNNYFRNYVADSYRCKDIEHGALFDTVDEMVSSFVGKYSAA